MAELASGPTHRGHADGPGEGPDQLVGGDRGEAQGREGPQQDDPQGRVAGCRFDVADGQGGVGRGHDGRGVVDEQGLLGPAVEVAVRLGEAQAVGQQVGRLVVVDAVTAERVPPLHEQYVGHPDDQAEAGKEEDPPDPGHLRSGLEDPAGHRISSW